AAVGVDDGFGAAGFVGGPDGGVDRVEGQPVRVVSGRCLADLLTSVLVEGDEVVGAGGGGVHPVPFGYHQDTVDLVDAVDDPHDRTGVHIDLDDLAGAQVRDEQQTPVRVQAGVVEPGAVTGQRDLTGGAQRQRHLWWCRCRTATA